MKRITTILLCFCIFCTSFYARTPYVLEAMLLDLNSTAEEMLKNNLGTNNYIFDNIHPSYLGPMLVNQLFIRDIVIKKPFSTQSRAELIIYVYDTNLHKATDSLSIVVKIDNRKKIIQNNDSDYITIRLGVISVDKVLRTKVSNILETTEYLNKVINAWKNNEMFQYEEIKDAVNLSIDESKENL